MAGSKNLGGLLPLVLMGFLSLLCVQLPTARAADSSADLDTSRAALQKYQDPIAAVRDGYFSTVACIDFPKSGMLGDLQYPAGAMGVHFLNPAMIGKPLDLSHPQVLLYEPQGAKLQLVGAEWFVPYTPSTSRPMLFGHQFYGPMMGHYPVMRPEMTHYDLHVWLFKANPSGTFAPTNSNVKCPPGMMYTFHDATPMMPMGSH